MSRIEWTRVRFPVGGMKFVPLLKCPEQLCNRFDLLPHGYRWSFCLVKIATEVYSYPMLKLRVCADLTLHPDMLPGLGV